MLNTELAKQSTISAATDMLGWPKTSIVKLWRSVVEWCFSVYSQAFPKIHEKQKPRFFSHANFLIWKPQQQQHFVLGLGFFPFSILMCTFWKPSRHLFASSKSFGNLALTYLWKWGLNSGITEVFLKFWTLCILKYIRFDFAASGDR